MSQLTHALARGSGLLPCTIANEVIVREVERFASKKETPNAGVLFDGDHAVYMTHARLFVCDDSDLLAASRPLADFVSEQTGKKWQPEIVTSQQAPSALRRLLGK